MQKVNEKPSMPSKAQLREALLNSTRGQAYRTNSAKIHPTSDHSGLRSLFSGNRRSNSARISRAALTPEPEEVNDEPENQEEHKNGCPWRKGRSRSKYRQNNLTECSSSGLLHPRPWGARNPTEIPCICKVSKDREASRTRMGRSPTRLHEVMTRHERQASRTKVAEIVSMFCTILDRKKLKLTEGEFNLLVDKVKEKLQKYKEAGPQQQQHSQQKQLQKLNQKSLHEEKKSPVRRPRTVQSLSPVPHPNYLRATSKEHLGDQARLSASPVVGKYEAQKCIIEMSAQKQVPTELNTIWGMIDPHRQEQQLVLIKDKTQTIVPVEDLRHYTVMNAGVQLSHHAENTTLLLGNQGLTPARMRAVPAVTQGGRPSIAHSKSRR